MRLLMRPLTHSNASNPHKHWIYLSNDFIVGSKIRLPSSCSMPLCKGSKPAQYSIREIFFIRLVSSCAILFASKVVEKL